MAIVNETMAKRYWPGRDPIGQQIILEGDGWVTHRTIVAVAADLGNPSVSSVSPIEQLGRGGLWEPCPGASQGESSAPGKRL